MENAIPHLVGVAAKVQNHKYYLKLPSGYMKDRFICFTYINVLATCVYVHHTCLWMVVNHYVVGGNQTHVFDKNKYWATSLATL